MTAPLGTFEVDSIAVTARAARAEATTGEEILIASPGHSAASPDRRGTILAVLGDAGREHYLVRWPDGCESILPAGVGTLLGRASPRRVTRQPSPKRRRIDARVRTR